MRMIADSHIPFIQAYFGGEEGELLLMPGRDISAQDVKEADILIVRSITLVNEALLAGSNVSFVGSVTAGADHLDTAYLDRRGIKWEVAGGFNAPPVADYVVSTIAALQRTQRLAETGLKAAVIGVGHVGQLVEDRLKKLGFEVVLCDPFRAQNEEQFQSVTLDAIADVDLICLHVPLTRSGPYPTYHFIDKDFLQRQRTGCVLLNASRGAVIDSKLLHQYGSHLTWCFDVWEHEPIINCEILNQAFIASPHIAGYSVQSKIRGIDTIYRIACENKIIKPQPILPSVMPTQHLIFAGEQLGWQDVVLGIFNPIPLTKRMKKKVTPLDNKGHAFDEMRHQFNSRHEFEFTQIEADHLTSEDQLLLQALGIRQ